MLNNRRLHFCFAKKMSLSPRRAQVLLDKKIILQLSMH